MEPRNGQFDVPGVILRGISASPFGTGFKVLSACTSQYLSPFETLTCAKLDEAEKSNNMTDRFLIFFFIRCFVMLRQLKRLTIL